VSVRLAMNVRESWGSTVGDLASFCLIGGKGGTRELVEHLLLGVATRGTLACNHDQIFPVPICKNIDRMVATVIANFRVLFHDIPLFAPFPSSRANRLSLKLSSLPVQFPPAVMQS
jgi:hypothetical protein